MIGCYIEALKNGKGYGWICEHGYELTKDELINIVKEFDFAVGDKTNFNLKSSDEIIDSVVEELEYMYMEE